MTLTDIYYSLSGNSHWLNLNELLVFTWLGIKRGVRSYTGWYAVRANKREWTWSEGCKIAIRRQSVLREHKLSCSAWLLKIIVL